jgi:hypothetical protein
MKHIFFKGHPYGIEMDYIEHLISPGFRPGHHMGHPFGIRGDFILNIT